MTIRERILSIRLTEKITKQKNYAKKIGLKAGGKKNISHAKAWRISIN